VIGTKRARGIRKRTKQVEDGARAEFNARRPDVLHRRMMCRREHKADAGITDTRSDLISGKFDFHA